jgi:hypothetical protein
MKASDLLLNILAFLECSFDPWDIFEALSFEWIQEKEYQ